jgi:hypothetical protein
MIMAGMVMMLVLLIIAASLAYKESEEQRQVTVLELGRMLQDELILASHVQEGYSRTLYLPEKIGRYTYSTYTKNTSVEIRSGKMIVTFPTPLTSGSFAKGDNIISNTGGEVRIN